MKQFLLSLLLVTSSFLASAQQIQHSCGFDDVHKQYIEQHPEYEQALQINEEQIQNIIAKRKRSKTLETAYTIPIVVHVIHTGEAVGVGNNISDAQINSGIAQLNNAFSNAHGQSLNLNIQFALATKDPNCNATTGINRIDGSVVTDYATMGVERSTTNGCPDIDIKNLSRWSNSEYYNFWIISEIDDNNGGAGIQGYAYFPGASSSVDGTMILNSAWGNQGTAKSYTDEGKTIIHEVGHAFNLYHTFEGDNNGNSCPTGNQCGSGSGDCCGDTPPHIRSASNCNTAGTNACDGGSSNELFNHNYMDYSSETCQYLFTAEQKTRMRAALEGPRASLLLSKGLQSNLPAFVAPVAASCTPATQADGLSGGFSGIMHVEIENKLSHSSSNAQNDGGYLDLSGQCQKVAYLELDSTYEFQTQIWFNAGDAKAWIDYNNNGSFEVNEVIYSNTNLAGNTRDSANFTIPSNATTSNHLRMRVICKISGGTINDACTDLRYGQAEDYTVYINPTAGAAPVAAFSANKTTVCIGETVTLTDASTNTPTSWAWTATGGALSSATAQNPTVTYNSAGTYSINLTATNATGSDPENKVNYITVVANPTVSLGNDTAVCSGSSVTLNAGNAGASYLWSTGATGQSISASNAGSYHVAVTNASACVGRDTLVLSVNALPAVSVNDSTICNGDPQATFTATAPTATAYLWSNNGTGTASTTNGTTAGTYTVTVTDANNCSASANGTLTVNALPTVSLGNDTAVCAGNSVTLNAGNAGASYLWSTGATGQSISASAADSYHVAVTNANGCVGRDTINISVNNLPAVSVNDSSICQFAGSATFTATAPTAVSYLWSGNGSGSNMTSSGFTAGAYTVMVTDANGCQNSASGTLTVNALPSVSVNDATICSGEPAATFTATAPTAISFVWSNNGAGTANTTSGITAGSYTVTVTDANNCQNSANGTLTVNSALTVNLGPDQAICPGSNVTLDAGNSGSTYLWNTGATGQIITPANPGSYEVTVTSAGGCIGKDTVEVVWLSLPSVSVNNATICSGAPAATFTATAPTAVSYVWSNNGTGTASTTSGSAAGSYTVTVTDANNCQNLASGTLTVNPLPSINLGNDTAKCIFYDLTLDAGSGLSSYLWNTGATSSSINVNNAGTYSVTGTNGTGCSSADTVVVTILDPNATVDAGFVTSYDISTGDVALTFGQPGGGSYNGNSGGGSIFNTNTAGVGSHVVEYYYTVSGCVDTARVTINVTSSATPPVANFSANSTNICVGETLLFTDLSTNSPTSWLWSITGATPSSSTSQNPSFTFNNPGTYNVSLTATNADGSDAEVKNSYITVSANDVANINSQSDICINEPVFNFTLGAGSTLGGTWSGTGIVDAANGTFDPSSANTGTHAIYYQTPGACPDIDTLTFTVKGVPVANLGNDIYVCDGVNSTLGLNNDFGASYLWNTGATTRTIIASTAGKFKVTVSNGTCSSDDSVNIVIYPLPIVSLGNDTSIFQSYSLDAENAGSFYSWSPTGTSRTIAVTAAGTYSVQVTTFNGCKNSDTIVISLDTLVASQSFITDYDVNQGNVTLDFGQPSGGVYSGTGVSGNVFNTQTAGVGSHKIYYTYVYAGLSYTDSINLTINVSDVTGIATANGKSLSVTPNPFNDSFTINFVSNTNAQSYNYSINSSGGDLVATGQLQGQDGIATQNINASLLAPGVYYLSIQDNDGVSVVKIIKGR